eukprot:7391457-Prymnesium_polylepis.1
MHRTPPPSATADQTLPSPHDTWSHPAVPTPCTSPRHFMNAPRSTFAWRSVGTLWAGPVPGPRRDTMEADSKRPTDSLSCSRSQRKDAPSTPRLPSLPHARLPPNRLQLARRRPAFCPERRGAACAVGSK